MLDEGGLDFGGREPMSAHVHHVIHSTSDPIVALMVSTGTVTGKLTNGHQIPFHLGEMIDGKRT